VLHAWLKDEDEIETNLESRDETACRARAARAVLSQDQVRQVLDACASKDFEARRDMAINRLLFDAETRKVGRNRRATNRRQTSTST
jgi:site-specific recombinase XerC